MSDCNIEPHRRHAGAWRPRLERPVRRPPGPDPDHHRREDQARRRESPLAYTRDGERIVIVASKGGAAEPSGLVPQRGGAPERDGRAERRALRGDSHGRRRATSAGACTTRHVAVHPGFADYEKRTDRVIPVIVLKRKAASAAA